MHDVCQLMDYLFLKIQMTGFNDGFVLIGLPCLSKSNYGAHGFNGLTANHLLKNELRECIEVSWGYVPLQQQYISQRLIHLVLGVAEVRHR